MGSTNLKKALILFLLGFAGILSTLTISIPAENLPPEVLQHVTYEKLKLLALINPIVLLIVAVIIGNKLHEKVNLQTPVLLGWLNKTQENYKPIFISGVIGGCITGISLIIIQLLFSSMLAGEVLHIGKQLQPTAAIRLLYGGFTEEIIMRFGLMTFLAWLLIKAFKSFSSFYYWIAIVLSSIIFAAGHLPIAFHSLSHPSDLLISYIILANTLGGMIFGYLYWKKGLEAAMLAHIVTHLVFMAGEKIVG